MTSRRFCRPVARVLVAAAMAVTMLLADQQQGLSAAAAARPDPKFNPTKFDSLVGRKAEPAPRPADPAASRVVQSAPVVAWPAPGSAEVAVPVPGSQGTWALMLNGGRTAERARAGKLPVWVAPTASAAKERLATGAAPSTPAKVRVELLGRRGDGLALKVTRADGSAKDGKITLGLDYREFRDAFGGDWATRLRFSVERAGRTTVIPSRNNGSGDVAADLPVSARPGTFMVTAGPSSGAGDYKRSGGDAAATWNVGGSSGDFEWSLPLDAPPAANGPEPELALQYSSGALDGLSSATNNQPSDIGQGFNLSGGGAIERRFRSCSRDKTGNNREENTGDLCFAGDSLTVSVAGKSGALVLAKRDATGEVWRMRGDDGSVIERLSGAVNGDDGVLSADKGEYWRMTTRDGTKYYFGLNRLPGWTAGQDETNSAWTVPAYGNHTGEQCNKSAFAYSWCQQAYQWNLDYVVDRFGNTMSYFYETEIGRYSRFVSDTAVSRYVRAGHLKRIDYGQLDGQVFSQPPVARVHIATAERCTPLPCGPAQQTLYPDTPWDLNCSSDTNCKDHYSPTFWTQKRVDKVTTQVWRESEKRHADVQSWLFSHQYLRGDNTSPGLWLKDLTPVGLAGPEPLQLPATSFEAVAMPNRVDTGSDAVPPLEWFRIRRVHNGTGGDLTVDYSTIECAPTGLPAPDLNDRRCRPQKWAPENSADRQDWFHKYVVRKVVETDRTVAEDDVWQAPVPMVTTVDYLDKPAWRFEEQDAGTDLKDSTWSQWRGYGKVRVTKGREDEPRQTTESLYFRGMDGDRRENGTVKDVRFKDSTGAEVEDVNEFAGRTREQITLKGAAVVTKSIQEYNLSAPTATMTMPWGTLTARRSAQKQLDQYTAGDNGLLRVDTENSYDTAGRLISKEERNTADPADDACTRYYYVENHAKNLLELPSRQVQVAKSCAQTGTNADVIRDERLFYDNATSITATPTLGLVTRAERLAGFDSAGAPRYEPAFTAGYDARGRQTWTTNALNQTERKIYSPAYGPLTELTEVAPNGMKTVTEFDPAFGAVLAKTAPDGRKTVSRLDALGRVTKAWDSGSPETGPPSTEREYLLRDDGASVVTTKRRIDSDTTDLSYELFDGLGRIRQTQEPTPAGGWLVTDHRYDSRGNKVKVNGPYHTRVLAEKELNLVDEATLPKQEVTSFDESGRPVRQSIRSFDNEKWATAYDGNGFRQSIDPPDSQTPTARITDAEGRLTEVRHYHGSTPTGTNYDKIQYRYWPSGQLKSVTDTAGNVWSYEYDIQGRKIKESDPDKGITRFEYDGADQLVATIDARGVKLVTDYDQNGRRTAVRKETPTGSTTLSEWTYDTVAPGRPATATRYLTKGGTTEAYTTKVTGYDAAGRVAGTSVTLPASEGKLAGTYTIGQTYQQDGQVASRSLPKVGDPAAGGLAAETLQYGYNDQGLVKSLKGQDTYLRNISYTPFEDADVVTLGTASGPYVQQKFEYDKVTRRISRIVVDKELAPERVSDTRYEYDAAGNITKISDLAPGASGEATDTQCFRYDYLRRLTRAWTPKPGPENAAGNCAAAPATGDLGGPAPYWQEWTFDQSGNRKTEQRFTPAGTTTSTYLYDSAKPHALTGVTTSGPNGATATKTFGYDETGNTIRRTVGGVDERLDWNPDGSLAGSTKGSASTAAVYDADGNRLIRRDASGTTLYLGETEIHLDKAGTTVTGTRYYGVGDQVVGVRTGGKLSWLLADLQGTPNTVIDAVSQAVQRRRTTPYGELRGAAPTAWPGQRDFHGGTNDPDTALVHLAARSYDKSTGRFLSVDPLTDLSDPQQLTGYAYANDNPVSYVDKDGRAAQALVVPTLVQMLVQVAAVVLVLALVSYLVSQLEERSREVSFWDIFSFLWRKVVEVFMVLVTFLVWVWQQIEQLTVSWAVHTYIQYNTVYRNEPDKSPRNNSQGQRGNGNQGKSNGNSNSNAGGRGNNNAASGKSPNGNQGGRQGGPRQQGSKQGPKKKGPANQQRKLGPELKPGEKLYRGGPKDGGKPNFRDEPPHYRVDNGAVKSNYGPSTNTNPAEITKWGRKAHEVDTSSVPSQLRIVQTKGSHYEVVPREGTRLTADEMQALLDTIKFIGF